MTERDRTPEEVFLHGRDQIGAGLDRVHSGIELLERLDSKPDTESANLEDIRGFYRVLMQLAAELRDVISNLEDDPGWAKPPGRAEPSPR